MWYNMYVELQDGLIQVVDNGDLYAVEVALRRIFNNGFRQILICRTDVDPTETGSKEVSSQPSEPDGRAR